MSNQAVLTFINKAEGDSSLRNRLVGLGAEGISKVAAQVGCNFTVDEWVSTLGEIYNSELSDQELNQVAGGANSPAPLGPLAVSRVSLDKAIPNAHGTYTLAPQ